MSQSVIAPEKIRTKVKVAGSMRVCRRADRQSREFPPKAIMASEVRMKRREGFTAKGLSRMQKSGNEKLERLGQNSAADDVGYSGLKMQATRLPLQLRRVKNYQWLLL